MEILVEFIVFQKMNKVYTYEEAKKFGPGEIGNKSTNLIRLSAEGVCIPNGVIIPKFIFGLENLVVSELQEELEGKLPDGEVYFCVRSSSTNEDSGNNSYAGQYKTYCGVRRQDVGLYSVKVAKSLSAKRAQAYREKTKTHDDEMSVLIQELVPCDKSGILFTKNPLNGNVAQFVLEAGYGLGDPIVSGEITPDNYVIDLRTGNVKRTRGFQEFAHIFRAGNIVKEKITPVKDYCLTEEELKRIVNEGKRIEEVFNAPQDIEWGMVNGNLIILQARNITT